MPNWLIRILGSIYERIPERVRPIAKKIFWAMTLRIQAVFERKKIYRGERVAFVDHEIADLEPYEFLGPGQSQVTVRAVASTISPGTENAVLCGLPGARRRFPYYPGYSCAGIVETVGSKSSQFKVGDKVAGRISHTNLATVETGQLFLVPDNVDLFSASFIELGIIVLQGVRKARILPGQRVVVLGQGLIGQLCNRFARFLGAGEIIAAATSRRRESIALRQGGADRFVKISDTSDISDLAADIVLEAVGLPDAIETSMQCARDGGRVALIGSSRGLSTNFDIRERIQRRNIEVIGAHISAMPSTDCSVGRWTYRREGELFLELLETGYLSVKELVSWDAKPSEANAVYECLANGGNGHVAITFGW